MLSYTGVWELVVKVLVGETESMCGIMGEIVVVHIVVVQEHASVEVLWEIVEADVVPMSGHEFIEGELLVPPVRWHRQGKMTRLKDCHLTLEVLILASVVILVSIADTNS